MNAFLREVCALGLLSPDRARQVAESPEPCEDPSECARRLVEAGCLTALQAQLIRAGKSRRLFVGPYVLLEKLGSGGMASVYRAEHRIMKRVAALKIVSRKTSRRDRSAVRLRFQREVEAAGRLHHPNIVAAFDAGRSRGRLYLAMEFVEGVDLERQVGHSGPLSIDLACEVIRQTAAALHYIHQRGLIHRDIKPSNLLLSTKGTTVKLLDLELARPADLTPEADQEPGGTPDYMPPECAKDLRQGDIRGDLYSLGCTFYFLLTGQVPFPGGSWSEKLLRHSLDLPEPVRSVRPEIPEAIVAVVERLMARDPNQRYATAADVLAALAFPGPDPIILQSASIENDTPEQARRRTAPRFFSATLVAMMSGLALAGGARWFLHKPAELARAAVEKTVPSIRIESSSASFQTLEEAIAAARDGDTFTIHSPGPFLTRPLNAMGKALTLRAGPGVRPRIALTGTNEDPWQALFSTDRLLTLEGLDLELVESAGTKQRSLTASIIRCERASLRLTDCRLKGVTKGAAIVVRNAGEVLMRGCRIDAGTVGLSVEVGEHASCRIRLLANQLTVREKSGAGLSVWAPEVRQATRVELNLFGNTIQAGRVVALRSLPRGVRIESHGNRFTFGQTLLSFTGSIDRDISQGGAAWEGDDNVYEGPSSRVWVDGQPMAPRKDPTSR